MPRKVDPHWGDDGFHDPEPFALTVEQGTELAALIGVEPSSKEAGNLSAAVEDIGTQYNNWHERGPAAFTRAEAREALELLLKRKTCINSATLTGLNGLAYDRFLDALHAIAPAPANPDETVFSALLAGDFSETVLRRAMEHAIEELKAQKGPERQGEVSWVVWELCRLYEKSTGKRATHSNKGKDLGYRQEPQSEAGRFVRQCFKLIDSKVLPSNISQAMRFYVKSRR